MMSLLSADLEAEPGYSFYTAIHRFRENYEEDHARAMFTAMSEADMAVSSTLYILRVLTHLDTEEHQDDAELLHIPARIQNTYRGRVEAAARRSPQAIKDSHMLADAQMRILYQAHKMGVMVLAGSDSGAFNSFVYPGDSLHRELEVLVESGFTPQEALQTATINGARWLANSDRYGTLAPGKAADILLLSANPLDDIRNTRTQQALVRAGRYLDSAWLMKARDARFSSLR